jgi:sulfate/thiosulfate-binding protein
MKHLVTMTILALTLIGRAHAQQPLELLNVSYDPTRELWRQLNDAFGASWVKSSGTPVVVKQSHGGSSAQARAVIDGLEADVVTLALHPDTDAIRKAGLLSDGWQSRFPNDSVPYTSTIVFVVRKGNPKGIKDWPDLVKADVQIITPNPKTSGNGKLSFLAAWGAVTQRGGSDAQALEFVTKLYKQVPVLDSGARGSTTTFAQKKIGDVHLTWENEAHLEVDEAKGELEIVFPPLSILATPPVAVVDGNAKRHKTEAVAEAYLKFVFTPEGQEIVARNFYRPTNADVLKKHSADFPDLKLFPITALGKSWDDAFDRFFAEGKVFDTIYRP